MRTGRPVSASRLSSNVIAAVYGYRRIQAELSDQGITCAPARIRRIMAERKLRAIQLARPLSEDIYQ